MTGKKALQAGVNVAQDNLDGDNLKTAVHKQAKQAISHSKRRQVLVRKVQKGKRKAQKSVRLPERKQKHLRKRRSLEKGT